MNLRSLDLNLLVIFDAVMTERHVTRAAARIAMSQPAMSNALARLRYLFKDELFIRTAGRMEPTPRALELGVAVQQILRQAERLMATDVAFDPHASEREFTARMSDLIGYLSLPRIAQLMRAQAPSMVLNVIHTSPESTLKALELDELDFALSMELSHGKSIHSQPLFEDRMCCVMHAGHPLANSEMTMARFLKYPHMRVAMSPTDIRFVDNVLAEQGRQRLVTLTVPHWLLVPRTLQDTDLLAVVSSKLVEQFLGQVPVIAKPLPFESAPFMWRLYWHKRYDKSPAHEWMRGAVINACAEI